MDNIKVIKPEVEIVDLSKFKADTLMENVGRVCYNSYDKIKKGSAPKFIFSAAKKGHRSIFEFNTFKLDIVKLTTTELENLEALLYKFSRYIEYNVSVINFDKEMVTVSIYSSLLVFLEMLEYIQSDVAVTAYSYKIYRAIFYLCKNALRHIDETLIDHWKTGAALKEFANSLDINYNSKTWHTYKDVTNIVHTSAKWKKILVKLRTDKGVHNEVVRHRLCSFMAESQRYVRYGRDNTPLEICLSKNIRNSETIRRQIVESSSKSFETYKLLLSERVSPQEARPVLPIGTAMTYFVYATAEEWSHIFRLRTASPALPLMQETMKEVREKMINKWVV